MIILFAPRYLKTFDEVFYVCREVYKIHIYTNTKIKHFSPFEKNSSKFLISTLSSCSFCPHCITAILSRLPMISKWLNVPSSFSLISKVQSTNLTAPSIFQYFFSWLPFSFTFYMILFVSTD